MSNSKGSEELLNPGTVVASREQAENILLKRAVRRMTAILVLLGLAFCFFASSICITVIFAGFLAILVEPWVKALEKIRIPRVIGAALVILLGAAAIGTFSYASYGKLRDFSDDFPRYVTRIADAVSPISSKIRRVQDSAGALAQEAAPKKVPEVRIRESTSWAEYLVRGMGSVWGAVIIAAVVPFLMYFILLARDKMYLSLKAIFAKQLDLDQFLGRLNGMVRSYVAGNLIIGALMSAITVLVFWQIGLAPAAILGVISGLLNLIPFLGMLMALGIPMMAGLFQFHTAGPFVVIGVTVVALHLLVANLLIPRFVGSRLDIGPVAATIGLLFWGWLWGIPGLLLAVPLTAFVKLLADTQPSLAQLSSLLARDPHKFLLRRARKPAAEGSAARPNAPQPSPSADVL